MWQSQVHPSSPEAALWGLREQRPLDAITGNPLLLRAAEVEAELDGVPGQHFGPIVHPLKVVFGFARRATAPIHANAVSKSETAATIYKERRHPACF